MIKSGMLTCSTWLMFSGRIRTTCEFFEHLCSCSQLPHIHDPREKGMHDIIVMYIVNIDINIRSHHINHYSLIPILMMQKNLPTTENRLLYIPFKHFFPGMSHESSVQPDKRVCLSCHIYNRSKCKTFFDLQSILRRES